MFKRPLTIYTFVVLLSGAFSPLALGSEKATYIHHPFAKKGLTVIDKEGVYHYKVKASPQDKAASLRLGFISFPQLTNKEGTLFSSLYPDSSSPFLLGDYEWQFWRGGWGKLGIKVGSGIYFTQGNGVFKSSENAGKTPKEVFTFVLFPNNASVIYRAQLWDTQWLVPFAEGGLDYFTFLESRDDHKNPPLGAKAGGALAAHWAAGAGINTSLLAKEAALELDREYGINSAWFMAEFRMIIGLNNTYDFSSSSFNFGVLLEF
ncbi:MAG: hypothetical protein D6797_04230 [Bdellovibrio sp.]|nr:MAG: hypothetical protein D6797_04230 [Bdellovibrio sp.]